MHPVRLWRTNRQRYRLLGSHCTQCGAAVLWPNRECSACASAASREQMSGWVPAIRAPQPEALSVAMRRIRCSVVIPSYQSAQTIAACLSALLSQDFAEPFEIIVVDSSTDGTAAIIREQFPQVTLIALSRQTLPGPARNLGVQCARGEIIAFLDADCVPGRDWLAHMVAAHDAGHAIVGGAVLNGTSNSTVGWAGYIGEFREFLPQGEARQVAHIPTCNISYEASIFRQHGGFPEAHYPQEDLLFNWMLSRQGEHILFDPAIRVTHTHRTQIAAYLAHQHRIGRVTAQVLRLTDLPGAWLVRRSYLALVGLPLMAMLKFLRTLRVFLEWRPASVWQQPVAWLVFALGLASWSVGLCQGLKSPCIPADQAQVSAPLKLEGHAASA
jgi:GT2 family glycosyltransferase